MHAAGLKAIKEFFCLGLAQAGNMKRWDGTLNVAISAGPVSPAYRKAIKAAQKSGGATGGCEQF